MQRVRIILVLALCSLLYAIGFNHSASAQTPPAPVASGGISVSPGFISTFVSKDAPEQTVKITLTNNYDSEVVLGAELRDIDENAGLLVPTGPLEQVLANSIVLSETDISIPAKEKKEITLLMKNTEALSPGGHYATLLLTQRSQGSTQLSLQSAISLNIFLIKKDGAKQSLKVNSLKFSQWLLKKPSKADLNFVNDGNVHLTPRASVQLLDRNGNVVANGVANEGSQPLFPTKSLLSSVRLKPTAKIWYPQRLSLLVLYRADGQTESQAVVKSFWYLPPAFVLSCILVLAALTILVMKRKLVAKSLRKLLRKKPKAKKSRKKAASSPQKARIIHILDRSESSNITVKNNTRKDKDE